MRPYICVSHAAADRDAAGRFFQELTRYGFRYSPMDEDTPRGDRPGLLSDASLLVVLTSPAAEACGVCASDIRYALGAGRPVICVTLQENRLDARFCANPSESTAGAVPMERIVYPAGEAPDPQTVAYYMHRLYFCRLCRLTACHSAVRCVDDTFGRTVKQAAAAHAGQTQAQLILGQAYERGEGAPRMEDQAAYWFARAAAGGAVDAMIRMGEYKMDGTGTPRDPAGALTLFRQAAEAGDPRGLYHWGLCSLEGHGMMRDPELAVRLMKQAAEAGYTPARYRMALLYRDGVGTAADWRAAVRHLYIACASLTGYRAPDNRIGAEAPPRPEDVIPLLDRRPVALRGRPLTLRHISMRRMREVKLGRLLFGAEAADPGKAARIKRCMSRCHYRRVAYREEQWLAMTPDPSRDASLLNRTRSYSGQVWDVSLAAGALGRLLELGSPADGIRPAPLQALRWYRRAMARGHSGAMFRLGDCYRRGLGVPRDPAEAVRLYRQAATLHNQRGQFALAVCYEQGEGIRQDATAAVHWYEEAARSGYAPAQNNLGGCYARGFGVPRDIATAAEWFMKAAAKGQPDAACRLGICYERGEGVGKDVTRAFGLYEQAARVGHPYALYRLGLCYDRGICVPTQFAYAAHLYQRAAEGGVAAAAYAMGLCARTGRGMRRDGPDAYAWFRRAGRGGSVQGAFEAGRCLLEGRNTVRNARQAVACFRQAAGLWRLRRRDEVATEWEDTLPVDGLTAKDAAGSALFLWGYCTLYGLSAPEAGETPAEAARRLFEEAAGMGHAAAATALGDMYAYRLLTPDGVGAEDATPAAREAALTWYRAAVTDTGVDVAHAVAQAATAEATTPETPVAEAAPTEASLEASVTESTTVPESGAGTATAGQAPCPFARRSQADAFMSLYAQAATGDSEADRQAAWVYLTEAARAGRDQALIAIAARIFSGEGDSRVTDRALSRRMLLRAAQAEGGSPAACLWLGDFALCGWAEEPGAEGQPSDRPSQAARLYRQALAEPSEANSRSEGSAYTEAYDGAYVIRARWEEAQALRAKAQSQAMYRLAVLCALHPELAGEEKPAPPAFPQASAEASADSPFVWLCRAILSGHRMAKEDLARMYQAEMQERVADSTAPAPTTVIPPVPSGQELPLGRKNREGRWRRDLRTPVQWMQDYYAALSPEPQPFVWDLTPRGGEGAVPEALSCPVTPVMIAAAMNFLGDCLFYGQELPQNRAEAVRCYREAASVRQGRGEPVCGGIVWAQYSLGWCLLHGVGTPQDKREAVTWLSRAAKFHGEAAFCLADCYQQGDGVDVADSREAVKYYRKAEQLGYLPAALKVRAMEKQLRKEYGV